MVMPLGRVIQFINNSHDYNNNDTVSVLVCLASVGYPISFIFALLLWVILAMLTLKHPLSSGTL